MSVDTKRKWNKYFAYTGDVANYNIEYEDFEYAKHGALVNASFADMVLNNDTKFPAYVCQNAVSNLLIHGVKNDYFVEKYKPFWLIGYSMINLRRHDYGAEFFYSDLQYMTQLAACLQQTDNRLWERFNKIDVDVVRFAHQCGRHRQFKELKDFLMDGRQGFIRKHMDLNKGEMLEDDIKGSADDFYKPLCDHHPLFSYEEIDVADILKDILTSED
ncbi:uncharacterized protein NDAI_0I01670 [Naumovozyma dairenensis CBS 421]|uniref:Uncharacterized protein n=1 Tax=Naumovozyma dairenensis (strain ATCC 10597 / BCRC 20456 / CBS 421 / NBRC 0211 / NRRL Y-12639) TaxID=1071378 RepID=G0WG25_NAUDC|nr:hypothetical protein NDAI_0I01670 [Naumovozyma dairenensis CBS 421]CCD26736.1 hypothetical protein NDAI_0I01670 [Naumovozyma dairenensis CBS 421]